MINLSKREQEIIQYIIEHPNVKQIELSEVFTIDKGNLSRICQNLKKKNILHPGTKLVFNEACRNYLIIEIFHTHLRYFTCNIYGEKTSDISILEFQGKLIFLHSSLANIISQIDQSTYDCIGCLVHSNIHNDCIPYLGKTDIHNFPIKDFISSLTSHTVHICNFANTAALTTFLYSPNFVNCHSLFFMRTSPGLGGGLVHNNSIFSGISGSAIEPAWMLSNIDSDNTVNDTFTELELRLLNEKDIQFSNDLIAFIENLEFILKNITAILDPEYIVIDSPLMRKHPHLIYSLNFDNLYLSDINEENYYKSISRTIFHAEEGITFNYIGT